MGNMAIHPSAIISPGAKLGEGVEVGPWALIGEQVELGAGCAVQAHAVLEGRVVAGERNVFGYGCVIGAPPQDFAFDPMRSTGVRIGNGNTFREYVTIHRGTREGTETVVGDGCYLMAGAHLGHNVRLGNSVILANNCLLAGYVEMGDRVVSGGGTVFHQFMRVGACAMVRGGARFSKDIPPYCLADTNNFVAGINIIGLRRAGFSPEIRQQIREAFRLVYRSGLNVQQALAGAGERAWVPEAAAFFEFIRGSKRGICKARARGAEAEVDE